MSGRAATQNKIPGKYALSVGETGMQAPRNWQWFRLTDVARLETGHTPSRKHAEYWDGDIPWIGIKDARENHGGTITETLQRVTQLGIDNSASRLLPERTVCLSRTASIGYAVVMGRPMATSQDFVNWVCSRTLDPEFLMHLFVAEKESLQKFGKGTTHKTIYFPEVKAFHVCVPPVAEQRRIVSKLESLQERGERARRALSEVRPLLEQFRQSVLAAAFSGRLTADWRAAYPDVEPGSELLQRIQAERRTDWEETELARHEAKGQKPPKNWQARYREAERPNLYMTPALPKGWAWAAAEELTKPGRPIIYGIIKPGPDTPGGVPYVRVTEMKSGTVNLAELKRCHPDRAARFNRAELLPNDILISKDGTIGKVALVPPELKGGNITQHVLRLSPSRHVDPQFIAYMIQSPFSQRWMTGEVKGIGLQGINVTDFRTMPIPLPPLALNQAIVACPFCQMAPI